MRKKKESLIVTFPTTAAAMQWEKYCIAQAVPGRLIPVPREITAGCGLAWKTEPQEEKKLREILAAEQVKIEEMQVLML